jgi:putative SOS response-associated peptidase YedK
MCNLYRLARAPEEVARMFAARIVQGANLPGEVYPGYPGLVLAAGEDGGLAAGTMTWGFPLAMKGKGGRALKPKAVTNAREDKLTTAFWQGSFARRRCLIPLTAWAEAEGPRGRMTRTWYAVPQGSPAAVDEGVGEGEPAVFAVAGLWRPSAEWGRAYAMVMADGCAQMAEVHDRMPVVLTRDDWATWLDAPPDEAMALCRTWEGGLVVERTREKWAGGEDICDEQVDLL